MKTSPAEAICTLRPEIAHTKVADTLFRCSAMAKMHSELLAQAAAHKGSAYRLGYAESLDGIQWERRDELVGVDVSPSGFDNEMIEYAAVVKHNGRHFMFYNGNNYGFDGIGLAVEE